MDLTFYLINLLVISLNTDLTVVYGRKKELYITAVVVTKKCIPLFPPQKISLVLPYIIPSAESHELRSGI